MLLSVLFLFLHATTTFGLHDPDITNKTIILSLAELSSNAYQSPVLQNTTSWKNSTNIWTFRDSYGWNVDGLRGHIFKHRFLPIITIAVKGTSLNSQKDKESANLICSCNCCFGNCTNACDKEKLVESLPNMYLSLLLETFQETKKKYPGYSIWYTGHSMGSVIASMAAVSTCNPSVGFSAPGEQLFSDRIGLEHKCNDQHKLTVHHIGYYKDPIFTGKCGWMCWAVGYNMDSQCHHGTECFYKDIENSDDDDKYRNEMKSLGSPLIYKHTINFLIDKLISKQETVPKCVPVENCSEKCNI